MQNNTLSVTKPAIAFDATDTIHESTKYAEILPR
jgi:hypothetical protein